MSRYPAVRARENTQTFVFLLVPGLSMMSLASALETFESALKQNGSRDSRHLVVHVRDPAAPFAARFKALGVRADNDGHLAPKSFYDTGVLTTISSDYIEHLTAVWRATNYQDCRLAENNHRGVVSRAYAPGPYAPSEFLLNDFTDWYVARMKAFVDASDHQPGRLLE